MLEIERMRQHENQKKRQGEWILFETIVSVVRAAASRGKVCNGLEPLEEFAFLPRHKAKSRL
jgi:hypothetical protein